MDRDDLIAAAREALKPIRQLHYGIYGALGDQAFCVSCWSPNGPTAWPCDTAKLIYTAEELEL